MLFRSADLSLGTSWTLVWEADQLSPAQAGRGQTQVCNTVLYLGTSSKPRQLKSGIKPSHPNSHDSLLATLEPHVLLLCLSLMSVWQVPPLASCCFESWWIWERENSVRRRIKLLESVLHTGATNEWNWASLEKHIDGLASWPNEIQNTSRSSPSKWQPVSASDPLTIFTWTPNSRPGM